GNGHRADCQLPADLQAVGAGCPPVRTGGGAPTDEACPVVAGSREESGCTGIGPCVVVGALAPGAVLLQKGHAPAVRSPRRAGAQGLGPVSLWEPPPRGRRGAW